MMKTDTTNLMKHFATILRNRAVGRNDASLDPVILKYLSRKELIEIIREKFSGTIPKQYDLIELENGELLSIIEDDMYIIAYCTKKWSREPREASNNKPEKKESSKKKSDAK